MIVYLLTNLATGKKYVGQTVQDPDIYWGHQVSKAYREDRQMLLWRAIRKYGKEGFSREVIHVCDSKEEMDFVETFYISLLSTKYPFGYNMTDGGEGTVGHKHSYESIQKIKSHLTGKRPSAKAVAMCVERNKTRIWTEEMRKKISEKIKALAKAKAGAFSPEAKAKMGQTIKAVRANKYWSSRKKQIA